MSHMSHIVRVRISRDARAAMIEEIIEDDSVETGGILLGEYDLDACAHVRVATGPGPKAYKRGSSVDFDASFLQGEQDRLMEEFSGLRFLGDWHYHRKGKGRPSGKDIRILEELTHDPDYQLGSLAMILVLYPGRSLEVRGFRLRKPSRTIEIPVDFETVIHED